MAEGHNTGTPGAHIFVTTDGKNFTSKFFIAGPHASLMGARMISETLHVSDITPPDGVSIRTNGELGVASVAAPTVEEEPVTEELAEGEEAASAEGDAAAASDGDAGSDG